MRYSNIVFMQNSEDADEPLNILEEHGEEKALEYLMQWYTGEEPMDKIDGTPWGKSDDIYKKGNLVMSYNTRLGYIGLQEIYEGDE